MKKVLVAIAFSVFPLALVGRGAIATPICENDINSLQTKP